MDVHKSNKLGVEMCTQSIQTLHKKHPYILSLYVTSFLVYALRLLENEIAHKKKDVGMGLLCSVVLPAHCHLYT